MPPLSSWEQLQIAFPAVRKRLIPLADACRSVFTSLSSCCDEVFLRCSALSPLFESSRLAAFGIVRLSRCRGIVLSLLHTSKKSAMKASLCSSHNAESTRADQSPVCFAEELTMSTSPGLPSRSAEWTQGGKTSALPAGQLDDNREELAFIRMIWIPHRDRLCVLPAHDPSIDQ